MKFQLPKSKWWYPTAYSSWGEEEGEAIARVVGSAQFTIGPEVEAFEDEFATFHRMKYGIMVNSGSSANLIMVAALFAKKSNPLRRHDYALVPALAWSTTYAPLVQYGLRLKLMDCDETWCAQLPDVTGCRLVVGCSILGNPAHLPFLRTAVESHDNYLIEDNCESLGAWFGNQRCGTFGLMNSFSFYFSHQISAIEGGMILTNDPECAKLCRILRAHGWTRDVQQPTSFDEEYNFTHFGYNVRPLEMHAAIARAQLRKLPQFIKARQDNAKLFRTLTADLPVEHQVVRTSPSPFGLPFKVGDGLTRTALVRALRGKGIDCRLPTGGSFNKHPYGAQLCIAHPTPVADSIHDRGLFLGNAPYPIQEQIEAAVAVMRDALR